MLTANRRAAQPSGTLVFAPDPVLLPSKARLAADLVVEEPLQQLHPRHRHRQQQGLLPVVFNLIPLVFPMLVTARASNSSPASV